MVFPIYATTLSGLENILASEIEKIGGNDIKIQNRLVSFEGNMEVLYKANLWCRTAIRILKPIAFFNAYNEGELYKEIQKINWAEYLSIQTTFAIDAIINQSYFTHSLYVAQLAKDAIVDQFKKNEGARPSIDLKSPDVRISLYMNKNKVTLSLDSSGDSLHKRGYRIQTHTVPLNEVLAAGIIMHSNWQGDCHFVDGMCGTGTILTEAAMIALNIAPGFWRKQFGFMNWKDYNSNLYAKLYKEMHQVRKNKTEIKICGCDVNKKTTTIAQKNIKNAGLDQVIEINHISFEEFHPPQGGVIIMNPPYGARQEVHLLEEKYKVMGDVLKQKYSGYNAYIFTGNLPMAKKIGLRASKKTVLHNGAIECRLLHFELYSGSRRS